MDKYDVDIRLEVESVVEIPVHTEVEVPVFENDYEKLINKPCLGGVVLGKSTTLANVGVDKVTNGDIDDLFDTIIGK